MIFKQILGLIHKGTKVSKVVLLAQLTRELDLILFFFAPISIVCGLWLVLVSLSLLTFLFLPAGLLIALLSGLCKNICTLGGRGSLFYLRRRFLDGQLVILLSQIFYGGRINGSNDTIGMGSRLGLLRLV